MNFRATGGLQPVHIPNLTADEALQRLMEGHERFLRGQARYVTLDRADFERLAERQEPFATILGCADSRVPPELIFDATFGELFVIRVAGNAISPEVAGSMQYAASHLGTPLFVVLGHEGCGAIQAALATKFEGAGQRSRIQALVDGLLPGLVDIDPDADPDARVAHAVEANVRWNVDRILESPEGRARMAEGRIKVIGAIYDLETGRVRLLE
jgi:carbonic anhydrase